MHLERAVAGCISFNAIILQVVPTAAVADCSILQVKPTAAIAAGVIIDLPRAAANIDHFERAVALTLKI